MLAQLKALSSGLEGVVVYLDRATHLGRAPSDPENGIRKPLDFSAHTHRPLPVEFYQAETLIAVDPLYQYVSRNHALLVPEREKYYLADLNSLNGTYVKGKKIKEKTPLEEGDVFSLGSAHNSLGVQLSVHYLPALPTNAALLVGYSGGSLRGVPTDMGEMKKFLESRRGFTGNVALLLEGFSTSENLFSSLEQYKRALTEESLLVFYFAGHGDPWNGLQLQGGYLSPQMLYAHLDNIRGNKVVIIDSCHAGTFLEKQFLPENTLVFAATHAEKVAYEGYHGTLANPASMGHFTRALLKVLEGHPQRIDLKRLRTEVGKNFRLARHGQEPEVKGRTIFLPSKINLPAQK
ncbi:FHA domain-containing protein [Candidatus Woesearchaeota archaeon]|nr:FHA domain-containing protein [Candidatus Woesearchaeota archaeon]